MKRNLFAILVVVAVFVALVFIASPDAEAANGYITAKEDNEEITVSASHTILDLNGKKNVVVKIENAVKLSVIDTSFIVDSSTVDLTGQNAGTLKVAEGSNGSIAFVAFDGNFRYLRVTNDDNTYSFHPFNLAISKLGLNTTKSAICIRVTFIANDVVRSRLTDFGIKSVSSSSFISAMGKYPFGNSNGVQAYFDLNGSLDAAKLDATRSYQAYMKVDGVDVLSNYIVEITPREILKALNESSLSVTDDQLENINKLAANDYLADLFTRFTEKECTHSVRTAASCITNGVCKNCGYIFPALNPDGHIDENHDDRCDRTDCGSIVTTPNEYAYALLNGGASSSTWEITGIMKRPENGEDQWNFGFDIFDETGKKLLFSATSGGIVFERVPGFYTRYPYHYSGLSQYHLDSSHSNFHLANNTETTLYFKAVIENDVFYAWFGYTEDDMVLSWMIPLTEELTGRWGATQWADFNDDDYEGDDKSIPFPGFAPGSQYQVAMHVNSTKSASGSINNIVVKTGANITTKVAPKFLSNLSRNFTSFDYANGTLISNGLQSHLNQISLVGDSETWEISGTIERDGIENINFGFMLQSGEKSLRMSAVTRGIVFEEEEHSSHDRYPYHALNKDGTVTQYNKNTDVVQFLGDSSGANIITQNRINFKAIVANDMFYVWFWYDGEAPKLSWIIPLTEALTGTGIEGDPAWEPVDSGAEAVSEGSEGGESTEGTEGTEGDNAKFINPFQGFDDNSSYKMTFYVKGTTSVATISGFTVKTGEDVDTSWVDALNATPAN